MVVWFYDVSNHQATTPDLTHWDGLIVKASEGSNFRDARFWQHINKARDAGRIHAGYHFLRSDSPVKDQAATFMSVCPPEIAAVPDIESIKDKSGRVISAPTLAQAREFVDRLQQAGYHVPMQYLPRWYYSTWGSPSLDGMPPIWGSYYPDYTARHREEGWKLIPAAAKQGFGGLPMVALQFTSSPLDQNRAEYTPDEFYSFLSTTRRADMPLNAQTDWPAFSEMMERWFRYQSRTNGGRATWEDGPTIPEALSILVGRSVADIDEDALAEALVKRGIDLGGVDLAEMKQAFGEVLNKTKIATPPVEAELTYDEQENNQKIDGV